MSVRMQRDAHGISIAIAGKDYIHLTGLNGGSVLLNPNLIGAYEAAIDYPSAEDMEKKTNGTPFTKVHTTMPSGVFFRVRESAIDIDEIFQQLQAHNEAHAAKVLQEMQREAQSQVITAPAGLIRGR